MIKDGKSYVGEAKSTKDISEIQINFYESLLYDLDIDGLIFSTSENDWNGATKSRIEDLKSKKKDIISLTNNEIICNS